MSVLRRAILVAAILTGVSAAQENAVADTFRGRLLQATSDWVEQKLDADATLEVEGTIVAFTDLEARARATLGPAAARSRPRLLALAMAEDVLVWTLTESLRRSGRLPDEQAIDEAYGPLLAGCVGPVVGRVPREEIAAQLLGFPSAAAVRQRYRLVAAYSLAFAGPVPDDEIRARLAARNPRQNVVVSTLVFMLEPRFADAERRACAARDALLGGAEWEAVQFRADPSSRPRWRVSLESLCRTLDDSEYLWFILSHSVVTELLDRAKPGELIGPLRGPHAVYVLRLDDRRPRASLLELTDDNRESILRKVVLPQRLLEWSDAALERAVLRVHRRKGEAATPRKGAQARAEAGEPAASCARR